MGKMCVIRSGDEDVTYSYYIQCHQSILFLHAYRLCILAAAVNIQVALFSYKVLLTPLCRTCSVQTMICIFALFEILYLPTRVTLVDNITF